MKNNSSAVLNHEGSLESEGKRQASLEKLLEVMRSSLEILLVLHSVKQTLIYAVQDFKNLSLTIKKDVLTVTAKRPPESDMALQS